MKVKKDYTILKVYSFIYIQNKIVDLLKKALGGCRLQNLCIMYDFSMTLSFAPNISDENLAQTTLIFEAPALLSRI